MGEIVGIRRRVELFGGPADGAVVTVEIPQCHTINVPIWPNRQAVYELVVEFARDRFVYSRTERY